MKSNEEGALPLELICRCLSYMQRGQGEESPHSLSDSLYGGGHEKLVLKNSNLGGGKSNSGDSSELTPGIHYSLYASGHAITF